MSGDHIQQGAAQAVPVSSNECEILALTNEAFYVRLRWHGLVGKSHWRNLEGEAYGLTYQQAYDRAVENAKASRLPK